MGQDECKHLGLNAYGPSTRGALLGSCCAVIIARENPWLLMDTLPLRQSERAQHEACLCWPALYGRPFALAAVSVA